MMQKTRSASTKRDERVTSFDCVHRPALRYGRGSSWKEIQAGILNSDAEKAVNRIDNGYKVTHSDF